MGTVTVRIPEEKRDELKIIASLERRNLKDILTDLIDECIERHRETLVLLSGPEWLETIRKGKEEVARGVKGKSLHELEGGGKAYRGKAVPQAGQEDQVSSTRSLVGLGAHGKPLPAPGLEGSNRRT